MAAKPQNITHPTNTCSFLGCFGFSGNKKPPEKKAFHPACGKNKSKRFLRWPSFRSITRKSRTAKTVPVDNNNPNKAEAKDSKSHYTSKLNKKKSKSKSNTNLISSKPQSSGSSKTEKLVAREKPEETKLQEPEQPNIIIGNSKHSFPTRSTSSSSLPGSTIVKPKPKRNGTKYLSHTVSLPAPDGNKRVGNPRVHAPGQLQRQSRNNNEVAEKFDPLVGMSIIMVTLIIMLVWGRLCAILCTSAWFYFCPRFRTAVNNNNNNDTTTVQSAATSNVLDLDSEEYKKKVVLEGLLERNHRLTI